MNLERGFRRLFVVLSVAVIGLGTALDVGKLWSHARIYATLTDGSTEVYETWNLVGSPPYEENPATREMVAKLVREREPAYPFEEVEPRFVDPWQGTRVLDLDRSLETFRVVRGPAAWSWGDFEFTLIACGVVTLLWAGFFTVRWVARGFTSPRSP